MMNNERVGLVKWWAVILKLPMALALKTFERVQCPWWMVLQWLDSKWIHRRHHLTSALLTSPLSTGFWALEEKFEYLIYLKKFSSNMVWANLRTTKYTKKTQTKSFAIGPLRVLRQESAWICVCLSNQQTGPQKLKAHSKNHFRLPWLFVRQDSNLNCNFATKSSVLHRGLMDLSFSVSGPRT